MNRFIMAAVGVAGLLGQGLPAAAQDREFGSQLELVDPDVLRVCADPNNMPFSNEAEEGFEQAVAEFLAEKVGRSAVSYSYFPQATGFVRMTLGSNVCDVIMSYPQGDELVQNTNAYYRTAYALVYPANGDLAGVTTIADPKLKGKRVGIVAGTPPATFLARAGLMAKAKAYQLMIDTRVDNSAKAMIDDLDAGAIDAAVLWGPMAGYYARESDEEYTVVPLVNEGPGPATAFRITMGVRVADQEWKRTLNRVIAENQDAINEILLSYGIPLLDEADRPIVSQAGEGLPAENPTDTGGGEGASSEGADASAPDPAAPVPEGAPAAPGSRQETDATPADAPGTQEGAEEATEAEPTGAAPARASAGEAGQPRPGSGG